MQSWPRPQVPALASPADDTVTLRLYDTASGTLVDASPQTDTARLYVCGITPYDATHLGHAATYLAFDLVQRQWRDVGFAVHYVQNVTDVDDPLLERADATGQDWVALAERETQLFRDDMTALRVLPPDDYIGAVESIPMVLEMIDRLQKRGAVYHVDDDLYFDVTKHPDFGTLSGFDRDTMVALFGERGGDPDRRGKRNALDCLLWQAERPGEPAWDSTWGKGRPGWHIECAAIALSHLGVEFDIQGGGSDLVFPHHEMSAAQASVDTGQPFARHYLHAGMVGYQGEKMSKSKGNLVLVSALRNAGHDPMVIRLALLAHHYRDDWEWFDTELAEAQERWDRWTAAFSRSSGPTAAPTIDALRQALRHDLDAPRALSVIDAWCANEGDDAQAPGDVAQAVDALLGIAKS